jgi:hypothetical protein
MDTVSQVAVIDTASLAPADRGGNVTVPVPVQVVRVRTTDLSLLHWLFRCTDRSPSKLVVLFAAWALTLFPLLLVNAYWPGDLPNSRLSLGTDLNVLFLFAVSFPAILLLTSTDQAVLDQALSVVQKDGTVTFSGAPPELTEVWARNFTLANVLAQVLAVAVGALIASINYEVYSKEAIGFWISAGGRLRPVGYVFVGSIFMFYAVLTVYIVRGLAIAVLFESIVHHAEIRLLPMHPDRAGGLRPMGTLGLRNEYVLMLLGLNVVLLAFVSYRYLHVPAPLAWVIMAAVIAYCVLGPIVFTAPLLPFRRGMLKTKESLLAEVAQRVRIELARIRRELNGGQLSQEDEELIERLRKIGKFIDELPVWPFDASTLRKFVLAYVVPLLSSAGLSAAKVLFQFAKTVITT